MQRCQEEFERQIDITKLLLEGLSSAQENHVRCLNDFVSAQIEYFNQGYRHMLNLQRELASNSRIPAITTTTPTSASTLPSHSNDILQSQSTNHHKSVELCSNSDSQTSSPLQKKQAKCLNNYQATNDSELSVNEGDIVLICEQFSNHQLDDSVRVQRLNGDDSGFVPLSYLQIL